MSTIHAPKVLAFALLSEALATGPAPEGLAADHEAVAQAADFAPEAYADALYR